MSALVNKKRFMAQVKVLLFVLLIPTMFAQAHCSCCTSGFPSLEQLLADDTDANAELLPFVRVQGIFPTLRFTCAGNLTQLIYRTDLLGAFFPAAEGFEIWRNLTNISILQHTITKENETFYQNASLDTALYSVALNVPVQVNDYLGSVQVGLGTIQYLDLGRGGYYFRFSVLSTFNISEDGINWPFLPLVTAVISPSSSVCSEEFVSTSMYQTSASNTESQQLFSTAKSESPYITTVQKPFITTTETLGMLVTSHTQLTPPAPLLQATPTMQISQSTSSSFPDNPSGLQNFMVAVSELPVSLKADQTDSLPLVTKGRISHGTEAPKDSANATVVALATVVGAGMAGILLLSVLVVIRACHAAAKTNNKKAQCLHGLTAPLDVEVHNGWGTATNNGSETNASISLTQESNEISKRRSKPPHEYETIEDDDDNKVVENVLAVAVDTEGPPPAEVVDAEKICVVQNPAYAVQNDLDKSLEYENIVTPWRHYNPSNYFNLQS